MTTKEFNKVFEYDFKDESLNVRLFENNNNNLKVTIKKVNESDYKVTIEHYFEDIADEYFLADAEKIIRLINEKNLELQDYSDDQKFEMELDAMPDVDPIEETTYSCKDGRILKVYMIRDWMISGFPKFNEYYLQKKIKSLYGWYDNKQRGIILRSRKDAETIVKFINDNNFKPIDSKLRRTYPYHY